jgi:putative PIN family toxin of toxin-antitoxin system
MLIPRLVVDVNVLVAAIKARENSLASRLYQSFLRLEFRLVFSAPLAKELGNVLSYPNILARGMNPTIAFRIAQNLYEKGEYVSRVSELDWPTLTDKKDWYLLDLLFGSQATALITQDKKVIAAGQKLGMPVFDLQGGAEQGWY